MLEAVNRLDNKPQVAVKKISRIYETDPEGDPEQPDYLNAAVEVETVLDATDLLKVCLSVEKEMGRVKSRQWGPRNIDIDLLLYSNLILKTFDLTVPHPLMHKRGFVLHPLSDIAPDIVHPVIGSAVNELKVKAGHTGIKKKDDLKLDV